MEIKSKLQRVDSKSFIHDYLLSCGIENPTAYINAGAMDLESPSRYVNIDVAAERLHLAIENRERILVLVDEDCDGVCSSVIIYNFIKSQGLKSKPLFHYMAKAHGMATDKTENLIPEIEKLKPTLLIIPDASADEPTCKQLKSMGCDVIILDHHTYDFNSNPYTIVVNCLQQDGNHNASGTLVTQKFVDRYCELYKLPPVDNADLVAASVVSDVMSMTGGIENRAYCNMAMLDYEHFVNNQNLN